jgi:DNA-binding transcriptional LysR family regulator
MGMDWGDRIGRRLKLRDLHILLAVAQCGSMTKAARQLAVSNPVVSKAIGHLEHTLGVRLLDRGPRGIEPTIYGRALLDRGLVAFDELRQAVRHVEFLADPTAGEVRVGTSIAVATSFVSAVIDRLSRRYPRISFHLLAGEPSTAYRALEERNVDLVVGRLFAPVDERHLHAEILYEDPMVVVAGVQNPWTRRRKIALSELVNEAWALTPPESLNGALIVEAFRAVGLDFPRATVVTYTYPARRAMVIAGRFVTIVPAAVVTLPIKDPALKILPVDLPTTRRPIGIVTLRGRTLSPVAELFVKAAREIAATLGTRRGRN